jgi:hypothetical protein
MGLPGLLETGLQPVSFAKSSCIAVTHVLYNSKGLRHSSVGLYVFPKASLRNPRTQ